MAERETDELAVQRWNDLRILQEHYVFFNDLLIDVMEGVMGFTCTDIQQDIGEWVQGGPQFRMVQAQRGEAKTTITAIYAVWRLIQDPSTRILILSAGSDMATEIANWVIQIINAMPELQCLRPDRSAGDRSSVTGYDVHHSLKGPEKSASITCLGITSSTQGRRADVLIADDIESAKNSQTQIQRERINHLTKDFTSINSKGDIIWLGTPQSVDSLYNGLPGRGVGIRIWPGRYPTLKEEQGYEGFLAPLLAERMKADPKLRSGGGPTGDRGQPTDPVLLNEDDLTKKEIDQGASYFQLQHMLSTKLSDMERFPLKLGSIRFLPLDTEKPDLITAPMTMTFIRTENNVIPNPEAAAWKDKLYRIQLASDMQTLVKRHFYIDPSGGGQNQDEMAYACTGYLGGNIIALASGGLPGGHGDEQIEQMIHRILRWRPHQIDVEDNYGNGAFRNVLQPRLYKAIKESKEHANYKPGLEGVWEAGQKELRIIDTLEPIIGSGRLMMSEDIIREDIIQCQRYPMDKRNGFSLLWQLSRITKERKSLLHDDRLDALAGSCRHWVEMLVIDGEAQQARDRQEAYKRMIKNPLGEGRAVRVLPHKGMAPQRNRFGLGKIGHLGR